MNIIRSYPSLKHWRLAHKLTQREAAKTLGVSQAAYALWERRKSFPNRSHRERVRHETHVPLEVLCGEE